MRGPVRQEHRETQLQIGNQLPECDEAGRNAKLATRQISAGGSCAVSTQGGAAEQAVLGPR
jgi:hypothetical protein